MLKNGSALKVSANRMQNMKACFQYFAEVPVSYTHLTLPTNSRV